MQWKNRFERRSEDEVLKENGLIIDFDEIAKKGSISHGQALIAKWYGIYKSRQKGDFMARVCVPGGKVTSSQARRLAMVSEKFAKGKISVTTRQALQLHFLQVDKLADIIRELSLDGLSTFHGCGDVTRNVATCASAENCQYKRFNVMPDTIKTAKFLTDCRDLDNLPRKYKINFSGCGANCAQPYMNCLGAIAVLKKNGNKTEKGYKIVIGGGMGWKAFVAQEVFSFVPQEKISLVARAIAILFREHGDRYDRTKSRLKFVVKRLGVEKCREIILENLKAENVPTDGILHEPIEDAGVAYPERPLTVQDPEGTDGKYTVRIMIPKGELNHTQFTRIAELSEIYANQRIYTTNRQNIELQGVEKRDIDALKAEIEKMGYQTHNFYGLDDIVCCVGTTYCPKAVATTRNLYDAVKALVSREKYDAIQDKALINITGCPNSCSPYRIVDIGFRGGRIREEMGSKESFEILLGGSQEEHGQKLGDFKLDDCVRITELILDDFQKNSDGKEYLRGYVLKKGLDYFKEVVDNEL